MFATASWLEVIQALSAFTAMMFAGWQVYDAMKDAAAQKNAKDRRESRETLALDRQLSEFARLLVAIVFTSIGVVSLMLPPPPNPDGVSGPELIQHFWTRILLCVATVVLMVDGVRARRARRAYARSVEIPTGKPEGLSVIEVKTAEIDAVVHELKQQEKAADTPRV